MLSYAYGQSQFRFQYGDIPHPGDNMTWGSEGDFGIVIFTDRRGFPVHPVDIKLADKVALAGSTLATKQRAQL